jgi:hypothetical protein
MNYIRLKFELEVLRCLVAVVEWYWRFNIKVTAWIVWVFKELVCRYNVGDCLLKYAIKKWIVPKDWDDKVVSCEKCGWDGQIRDCAGNLECPKCLVDVRLIND